MVLQEMKARAVESVGVYLPKAVSALILQTPVWMDTVDFTIRVIAGLGAFVVSVFLVRRMGVDIQIKKEDLREKKLKNDKLENELKRKYEK